MSYPRIATKLLNLHAKIKILNIHEKQIIETLVVTAVVWIPKVKGVFGEGGCQDERGGCAGREGRRC